MNLFLLCMKIFFVRIMDVSLGTFRTMLMVKGKTFIAALIGFFEVLIWFLIVREAINTDNNSILIAISYASGFATGTYIGMAISDKYIKEILGIKIITPNFKELIKKLKENGFAFTAIDVLNEEDNKKKIMILIEINSFSYNKLNRIIKETDKNAFMIINESKYVRNGYFLNSNRDK